MSESFAELVYYALFGNKSFTNYSDSQSVVRSSWTTSGPQKTKYGPQNNKDTQDST